MAIASFGSGKVSSFSNSSEGKISTCETQHCFGECCEFDEPGYNIVLYPGELQAAQKSGFSIDHLRIVDDNFYGGQLAVCIAKEKINCDHAYKALDCFNYPFFVLPDKASDAMNFRVHPRCKLISSGCDLSGHMEKITKRVRPLIQQNLSLIDFFAKAVPKDYVPYRPGQQPQAVAQPIAFSLEMI